MAENHSTDVDNSSWIDLSPKEMEKKPSDPDDFPDGGREAWLAVLGAWCTGFCSFGWINSIGTFQDYYQQDLLKQYSASQISWIPSLQIFFMFVMGPLVGKMFDAHGPRRLLLIGTFLDVFGLMMASISTKYYQLLLTQGVVSAIGVACIFQPALSCVGGWFNKKRGMAYGILSTGSSLGGVVFPIMVSRLIKEISYGWAMRISAFLILGLLIIANLTVKSRFPPNPNPPSMADIIRPFTETKSLFVFVGAFLMTFGIFIPITYMVVEAQASGMSANLSQYILAVLNAASMFGRMSGGILSDKVGRYNVFIVVTIMTGILILGLWIPSSGNTTIILFAGLFGFFSGGYVSLLPALMVQISPPREIGLRTGLLYLVCAIPGLTSGPIAGAMVSDEGSFLGLKIFAGTMVLAGALSVVGAKLTLAGGKFWTVV